MGVNRVIWGPLAVVLVVGFSRPAAAELCEKCRGKAYITVIGKCTACGGQTSSAAFKLCQKCSAEQGRCQHCLARLDAAGQDQKKPPRPKPIDPNKSAAYSVGKWKYVLRITAAGTRSEGKRGQLSYAGKGLSQAEINDHYRTPWGLVYWVGDPKTPWGEHGWMPFSSPREKQKGILLPSPDPALRAIRLTAADGGKTVAVAVGKTILVSLEGNITTGYGWRIGELGGKAVESLGKPSYVTRPHQPGMVGVGGTFVFTFKAVRPGAAAVKLVYVRPWEKGKPPEKTFTVTFKVQAAPEPSDKPASPKKPPDAEPSGTH